MDGAAVCRLCDTGTGLGSLAGFFAACQEISYNGSGRLSDNLRFVCFPKGIRISSTPVNNILLLFVVYVEAFLDNLSGYIYYICV